MYVDFIQTNFFNHTLKIFAIGNFNTINKPCIPSNNTRHAYKNV